MNRHLLLLIVVLPVERWDVELLHLLLQCIDLLLKLRKVLFLLGLLLRLPWLISLRLIIDLFIFLFSAA